MIYNINEVKDSRIRRGLNSMAALAIARKDFELARGVMSCFPISAGIIGFTCDAGTFSKATCEPWAFYDNYGNKL
jgi:hypothetical protein